MKKLLILFLCTLVLSANVLAQTTPFVPRANNEGAIGTSGLHFGFGFFRGLHGDTLYWTTLNPAITASSLGAVTGTPWTSMGYLTAETDPNIYTWAKASTKPSYSASEVGLGNVTNNAQWYSGNHPTTITGYGITDIPTTLPASDVYAWAKASVKPSYTYTEVGADASGAASTVQSNLTTHANLTTSAHGGIVSSSDSRLTDARTPTAHSHAESDVTNLTTDLGNKQATLVSGTNIKTVNSNSLLGSGDIVISGGGAHASTHVTGGSDVIANAVAAGNSGLMSGTDKTKLDAITGTNTGDGAANSSSMYIGTTSHALNRASAAETIAGLTLTTPVIGVATGTSLAVTGAITSSGAGIGYVSGAGGTVTQSSSRTTGVTLSKLSGTITMYSSAVSAAASSTFTWTNTFITATDIVIMEHNSTTNPACWKCEVICAAGTATVVVKNISAASITEATPLKFIVIKAANN
jgi:hypothetical protein